MRARSGSTATRPGPSRTTRTPRSSCRRTSTRRPSSPARCTAAPTRPSTACRQRSFASASPTARARARRPSSRRSSRKAKAGEPLTIAGDGSQTRQFVYVEDLAEGMVAALAPAGAGRVYNLVGDEQVSVRQIADTVRELVADVPVERVPDRPVDLKFGQASGAARARRARLAGAHRASPRASAATSTGSPRRAARRLPAPPRAPPAAPPPSDATSLARCRRHCRAGARRRPGRAAGSASAAIAAGVARAVQSRPQCDQSSGDHRSRASASPARLKTPYGGR